MSEEKVSVKEYLEKHNLRETIEDLIFEAFKEQSENPMVFMENYFKEKNQKDAGIIEKVFARQVLDSRGNPTVEVDIISNGEVIGRAAGPSGASTGSKEAMELRDGDKSSFHGKSVYKAVANVNEKINEALKGKKVDLLDNDKIVLDLDGTEFKKNLGGNAITATSFALAYAGAKIAKEEPFMYLAKKFHGKDLKDHKFTMPRPMVNIINGGEHAGSDLMVQEFMLVPKGGIPFTQTVKMISEIYHHLKKLLVDKMGPTSKNVGDEGGFAPDLKTPDEALTFLEGAIEAAGYKVGEDVGMALDAAASEFYDKETKTYQIIKGEKIDSKQLVTFYEEMVKKHPGVISIEDSHDEEDYEGWKLAMQSPVLSKIMLVGDDLYTTNPTFIKKGISEKWANALLLKVNQIGAISEAMEAAKLEFNVNHPVIVSHRSGETATSLISDICVGIGAQFIKTGAPCRGERTVKYNRLLQIEEVINKLNMNSLKQ